MTKMFQKARLKRLQVFIVFLCLILVFVFPTYFVYKHTPGGKIFSGQAQWFDPHDTNVYVAAIGWSQHFGLNVENQFTTSTGKGVIFYPFYSLLGWLVPSMDPFLLYHLSIIVFGLSLIYLIYRLSDVFIKKDFALLATVLVVLGGGVGWIFLSYYDRYYDLMPELFIGDFTYYGVFGRPHRIVAMIFYLSSASLFYLSSKTRNNRYLTFSILSGLLLVLFYPFLAAFLYGVFFIYYIASKRKQYIKKNLIVYFMFTVIPLALCSLYLNSAPSYQRLISPDLDAPKPLSLVLGYGFLTPFIFRKLIKKNKTESELFLTVWFYSAIAIVLMNFGFSRYWLRGLFFPAVLLSVEEIGSFWVGTEMDRKMLFVVIVVSTVLSSLTISPIRMRVVDRLYDLYYIDEKNYEVIDYLRNHSAPGSGVLVEYPFGNTIPAYTLNKVYYGHEHNTPNGEQRLGVQTKFLDGDFLSDAAKTFLVENDIEYCVVTLEDSDAFSNHYHFLNKAFSNEKYSIFER